MADIAVYRRRFHGSRSKIHRVIVGRVSASRLPSDPTRRSRLAWHLLVNAAVEPTAAALAFHLRRSPTAVERDLSPYLAAGLLRRTVTGHGSVTYRVVTDEETRTDREAVVDRIHARLTAAGLPLKADLQKDGVQLVMRLPVLGLNEAEVLLDMLEEAGIGQFILRREEEG